MLRVSSLSTIFGGHKKKSAQVLEAFDAAAPAASPGLAGDTSPRYVWDKRTASLVSLDSAGASSADTVLLATPSQSASASPELPPDSLSLTPGHISSIQLIRERLYIGNVEAASELGVLRRYGVTHVVNTLGPDYEHFADSGLIYLTLRLSDVAHEQICDAFGPVCDFIQSALTSDPASTVFIHCVAGVSRSTTLVMAWLMKSEGLSAVGAMEAVRSVRPEARPNAGFVAQLHDWEMLLRHQAEGMASTTAAAAAASSSAAVGSGGAVVRGLTGVRTAPGGLQSMAGGASSSSSAQPVSVSTTSSGSNIGFFGRMRARSRAVSSASAASLHSLGGGGTGGTGSTSPAVSSPLREQVGLSSSGSSSDSLDAQAAAMIARASAASGLASGADVSTHSYASSCHSDDSGSMRSGRRGHQHLLQQQGHHHHHPSAAVAGGVAAVGAAASGVCCGSGSVSPASDTLVSASATASPAFPVRGVPSSSSAAGGAIGGHPLALDDDGIELTLPGPAVGGGGGAAGGGSIPLDGRPQIVVVGKQLTSLGQQPQ